MKTDIINDSTVSIINGPKGRMWRVSYSANPKIFIDYRIRIEKSKPFLDDSRKIMAGPRYNMSKIISNLDSGTIYTDSNSNEDTHELRQFAKITTHPSSNKSKDRLVYSKDINQNIDRLTYTVYYPESIVLVTEDNNPPIIEVTIKVVLASCLGHKWMNKTYSDGDIPLGKIIW